MLKEYFDNKTFLHIGYSNYTSIYKIMAIINPDSAPIRRLIQLSKKDNTLIDATQGRKTKSVIILENKQIILSALNSDKLIERINKTNAMEKVSKKEDYEEKNMIA